MHVAILLVEQNLDRLNFASEVPSSKNSGAKRSQRVSLLPFFPVRYFVCTCSHVCLCRVSSPSQYLGRCFSLFLEPVFVWYVTVHVFVSVFVSLVCVSLFLCSSES